MGDRRIGWEDMSIATDMKPELYTEVALTCDIPTENLKQGDTGVLVDFVSHPANGEEGAVLEIFNTTGESLTVTVVPITAITPLHS